MRLKDVLSEAIKIQGKPDHWPGDDHIILVTTAPTKTYVLKFNNKNDSYPNSIRFPNNMGTKPVDTNKAARELWLKIKADVVKWRSTNESVNESTEASEIIKDLDKVKTDLIKKVDVLIAKKKKLYSDVDITTPMSADEKKLDKDIQDIFSQIQQIIQQKRKIKTESINESNTKKDIEKLTSYKDLFKFFKDNKSKLNKKYTNDIEDEIGALKYLESDYKRGDADREEVLVAIEEIQDLIKKSLDIKESVNEGKYYVTYNKGRGQGKGLEKEFDSRNFIPTNKPIVFNSYNDAKKYAEKMEKIFRNSIGGGTAYWVSDEKMNPIKESILNEAREIKNKLIFIDMKLKNIFKETLIKEAGMYGGVPKMYVKYAAVQKAVRELEEKQKQLAKEYFAEKDLKKKELLLVKLKKGTQDLAYRRRNLSDIETKYLNNLYSDAELDPNFG